MRRPGGRVCNRGWGKSGLEWVLYALVILCGGAGVAYGVQTRQLVLAMPAGNARMQEIAAAIQETTNPGLRMRVVGTMFDRRTLHAADVLAEARNALPGLVYQTVIPRTIRLAEAPAAGQTIFEYAPDSNGAFAYSALAQEILTEDSGYGTTERRAGGYAVSSYAQPAA